MGNGVSAAVDGGIFLPSPRGGAVGAAPFRAKGVALTEEEELLLRGVAEKSVAQLVAVQREVARLTAREHELSAALAAAEASASELGVQLEARRAAGEQLAAQLERSTRELQEQLADLERSAAFRVSVITEQKDCALRELALLEARLGAATPLPGSPRAGGGAASPPGSPRAGGAASLPLSPRASPPLAPPSPVPGMACAGCGGALGGAAATRCGGCAGAAYCCRRCQVEHWPEHRPACEEAEGVLKRSLERARAELGDCEETLERMGAYCAFLRRSNRAAEALAVQRDMAAASARLCGEAHPQTLTFLLNAALMMETLGDTAAAEPLLAAALEGRRRAHGDVHPLTQKAHAALARVRKELAKKK
jgi:hypothetical protein